jgi:hypothetical protein
MTEYMNSFTYPLIEETHADLLSSISTLPLAPRRVIWSFKQTNESKPPKDFLYHVTLKNMSESEGAYEPMVGDLIALTDVRPKSIEDLDRPNRPYLVAYVLKAKPDNTLSILASKPILAEEQQVNKKRETLYAICLINMTTNIRIWRALKSELEGGNLDIIRNVMQPKSAVRILSIVYYSVAY